LERAELRDPSRVQIADFPSAREPVRIVREPHVIYVPQLRLQLLSGNVVPLEGILDAWTLSFRRKHVFRYLAGEFASPVATNYFDREVCILSNSFSRNFFHWITEELTKVVVLERNGFTGAYVLYDQPSFSREFLECLGIPADRIVELDDSPAIFREAVFMTPLNIVRLLQYPAVFDLLRNELLRIAESASTTSPRRIWLDRDAKATNGRELVNPEDVYPLVARYGFEVLDMAKLPICRQIAVARRADVMIGPHGSAFVHAMFMEPRSTVVECYSPEFINSVGCAQEICSMLRHRYFMHVEANAYGAYDSGSRLKIDCFQLELLLQSIDP
jgi:capsular polysaccharide biosynthesis protein